MNKKINSIVFMRAAAIMMVVLIHCLPNQSRGGLSNAEKIVTTFIHGLMNCGVPLFLMITGALLLHRREGVGKTLRRTARIAAVLAVFGLAMSLAENAVTFGVSAAALRQSVLDVISGQTWDVMWYLYMLTGLYLIMPLLSSFAENCGRETHLYILAVLFVFNSVIVSVNRQFGGIIGFALPCGASCLFYVLAGDYLFRYKPKIRKAVPILCIVLPAAAMLAISAALTDFDSAAVWLEYSSPCSAVMSVALFYMLMNVKGECKAVTFIADNSFGVYVIHCFYIHIINKALGIEAATYPLYISIPLMFAAVLTLSLLTSQLLRKIKPVRFLL